MVDAKGHTVSIRLGALASDGRDAEFGVSGTVITVRGFLVVYEEGRDDDADEDATRRSPTCSRATAVELRELEAQGHETSPPARYTEATLVKALEDRGIGRPSTYASILATILDRGYVVKRGTALVPTFLAFAVTRLLEQHYGRLVDYDFTARMEDDLDRIAAGDEERVAWLTRFYKGEDGDPGLHQLVTEHLDEIDARAVNSIEIPRSGHRRPRRAVRALLERGEQRASFPAELAPDELTAERAEELLAQPAEGRELGVHPETGRTVLVRTGRYGPYVTEELPEGRGREAAHRLASLVHVAGDRDARGRRAALVAPARRRQGSVGRRGRSWR
jgi:DNA topoisomerase-1